MGRYFPLLTVRESSSRDIQQQRCSSRLLLLIALPFIDSRLSSVGLFATHAPLNIFAAYCPRPACYCVVFANFFHHSSTNTPCHLCSSLAVPFGGSLAILLAFYCQCYLSGEQVFASPCRNRSCLLQPSPKSNMLQRTRHIARLPTHPTLITPHARLPPSPSLLHHHHN